MESAGGIYFRRGQTESFKAFMPMDTLHPEETGAAKLTLQSKVLDRTVYTSSNLVKILILTKGVDFFDTLNSVPFFVTEHTVLLLLSQHHFPK